FLNVLQRLYLAAITLIGIAWILDVPQFFGMSFIAAEWIGLLLGIGVAAAFLRYPYGERSGPVEAVAGVVAIGAWLWMATHYQDWGIAVAGSAPEKYVPGVVGIALMMEAMRKSAGLPITILVWVLIGYGLIGYLPPPPFQAARIGAPRLVMYVY